MPSRISNEVETYGEHARACDCRCLLRIASGCDRAGSGNDRATPDCGFPDRSHVLLERFAEPESGAAVCRISAAFDERTGWHINYGQRRKFARGRSPGFDFQKLAIVPAVSVGRRFRRQNRRHRFHGTATSGPRGAGSGPRKFETPGVGGLVRKGDYTAARRVADRQRKAGGAKAGRTRQERIAGATKNQRRAGLRISARSEPETKDHSGGNLGGDPRGKPGANPQPESAPCK